MGSLLQAPDYQGSDDYETSVGPFLRYHFAGKRLVNVLGPQISVNVLDDDIWQFGPMVVFRSGRDNDVEDAVVKQMHEIDDTVEAGAYVAAVFQLNPDDPTASFRCLD